MRPSELLRIAGDAEPWDAETARRERAIAQQLLTRHDGHGRTQLERENCAACVLHGYEPRGGFDDDIRVKKVGPNYAGWLRVWVQACGYIPSKFNAGVKYELATNDNQAYMDALKRDIVTFCKREGTEVAA
jgi:hypothetical protein